MNGILKRLLLCACAALALVGSGEEPAAVAPARLDVVARPEGAQVWVDGVLCGTAGAMPCPVAELAPGFHHVRVTAPSCVPADAVVRLVAGRYERKSFALEEERGLVLVKTTPAGADVRCGGVSLGSTPLLMTSLAAGRPHELDLSLNGHRPRRVRVQTEGRRPLVVEETLTLDSGVLNCVSEPAGATVLVNGVERGVTPVTVRNVPRGRATVTFRLKGYRDETRDNLHIVAGDRQTLSVRLAGLPPRVVVVSTPERANVLVDGKYRGKTPVTLDGLEPGRHSIRVELEGHAPLVREVEFANGAEATETFRLQCVLGRLEVVTSPPGAKILVDGRPAGTTKSLGGDATRSQILAVEGVAAGEHAVVAHLDGHQDASARVVVKPRETGRLSLKLARIFTPDIEIETVSGVHRGEFLEKDALGNITIRISFGVQRTFRRDEIRKVTPILK